MTIGASIDWFPLWLSLRVAASATAVAGVAGVACAYLLAMGKFRGRGVLEALASLPLTLPPTVLGYYLLVALGRNSPLGRAVEAVSGSPLVFTWQGAVVAATVPSLPLVIRTARAAFADVDPAILEAVRLDGAGRVQQLTSILLPLGRRGITAGLALAFARAIGEFGTTLMVAGNIPGRTQTMPLAIYDAVEAGRWETATVLAVVLTSVSIVLLLTISWLGERVG